MQASSNFPLSRAHAKALGRLVVASLRYHWRANLAVALAVMAAGAVLTGALLVGDSMRGSLRHLLLDQLGLIDEVLVTDRFFRTGLAEEMQRDPRYDAYFAKPVAAIYISGTVENPASKRRAGQVNVIGSGADFWSLGTGGPEFPPAAGEIVLNAPLAAEIDAHAGDDVLVRVGSISQIPPDSALGRKTETVRNRRLRVSAIIPAAGFGRFALNPSQRQPLDAFVATETLQSALDQPGRVNAIFVAGKSGRLPSAAEDEALAACLRPKLDDYGIRFDRHELGYVQLTSSRMLLDPAVVTAAEHAFAADHPQEILTYLANTIADGDRAIPYSTITAMDFATEPPLGPFKSPDGEPIAPLLDDEIALSTWAAEDLGAKVGDEVEITYFEPESTHGNVRESKAKFRLKAIVDLAGLAADPDLTPEMPGVTDQLSMDDWDPPFPFDLARVRDKDKKYWDDPEATKKFGRPMYRTTPKAFVSLTAGRRLWSSRFGDTTAVRFAPPPGPTLQPQIGQLALDPKSLGFEFRPIRRLGLEAAQGTTSFDGLFVGFSLFIMIASLLLVALLFRLGIEQRAEEIGVLRAVGMRPRTIFAVLGSEAAIVTAIGSLLGVVAGVCYAWLMLVGLSTWWLSAISTPFLELYVTRSSLVIGFVAGLVVSLVTVLWTLKRLERISVRRLLAGQTVEDRWIARTPSRAGLLAARVMIALAVVCALAAPWLGALAQAGAFVGSGALVLGAALATIWNRLRQGAMAGLAVTGSLPIARLAARNGARNPGRSTLSIGLIAAASFLIVALSAFRLDPKALGVGHDSGGGGFTLVAQCDQPIYQDLNSQGGRAELGFASESGKLLQRCDTAALRVEPGDDASCLNLFQVTRPRVLGVSEALVRRGGFDWAASAAATPEEQANPWLLVEKKLPDDPDDEPVFPAVVDFNTASYSLHKGLGDTIEIDDHAGGTIRLRIVGLLKNSIFQGDLLVGEAAFLTLFPHINGYRFFLVDTKNEPIDKVRETLEGTLGDYGFDAETTQRRLADFFAVQNTYLSTFQSLGGLGLLLGTFGLATVQLRSVLERRGELALMRAAGFRQLLLAQLVMIENGLLLVGGLGVGVAAAMLAVLPHWLLGGAGIPWLSLFGTLALVLIVGLAAGLLAVRATLQAELLPALREE